ncbi:MAG: PQQ-binding-like beta-propeller repeat protein, partial [Actinomycetes bacterium]
MDGHDNPNFKRRRILFGAASLGLALIAVVAWLTLRDPGDVSNTKATFTTTAAVKPRLPSDVSWPMYGYDSARTKWFRTRSQLGPPYHRMWSYRGKKVLEFSPVVGPTGLYLLDNGATVRRINKQTGKQIWRRGLGSLAASSPALPGDGRVYAVTLLTSQGSGHGSATALDALTGKTIWSRQLPSRAESSPLISGNRMIFGTESGTVFCLNKANGH